MWLFWRARGHPLLMLGLMSACSVYCWNKTVHINNPWHRAWFLPSTATLWGAAGLCVTQDFPSPETPARPGGAIGAVCLQLTAELLLNTPSQSAKCWVMSDVQEKIQILKWCTVINTDPEDNVEKKNYWCTVKKYRSWRIIVYVRIWRIKS